MDVSPTFAPMAFQAPPVGCRILAVSHQDSSCGKKAKEEILLGGRLTTGVVRLGDTVRRPVSSSSPFVARLLTHLAKSGFEGAPRYLGRDEHNRDILSYIHGWVPANFQQFEHDQIWCAGQLLQHFHAATAGTDLMDQGQVICHHDPGPNNVVFQEGRPHAFIDFDMATPGDPLEDIGYMAWTWCVSSRPDRGPCEFQAEQVRLLSDAYRLTLDDRRKIVDAIIQQQERNVRFWRTYVSGEVSPNPLPPETIQHRINWTRRERVYTRQIERCLNVRSHDRPSLLPDTTNT